MSGARRTARVRDRLATDLPRERLHSLGPGALSDAEVLALVLGTGGVALASRVLSAVGGTGGLARATGQTLRGVQGVGEAKAAEVVAALELGRRTARALAAQRAQILGPADAAALLVPRMAHLEREESVVLLLDRRHRVLRELTVGSGGIAASPMEPREIFASALREPGTAAVMVAHNHPSGDPTPSPEDVAITRRLARGADLLGLELVDHIVVAAAGWRSVRGSGAL